MVVGGLFPLNDSHSVLHWLEEFHNFQTVIVPFNIFKNMNVYKGL